MERSGVRMLSMNGRRYEVLWSGKGDGVGGVDVMMNEELCKKSSRSKNGN